MLLSPLTLSYTVNSRSDTRMKHQIRRKRLAQEVGSTLQWGRCMRSGLVVRGVHTSSASDTNCCEEYHLRLSLENVPTWLVRIYVMQNSVSMPIGTLTHAMQKVLPAVTPTLRFQQFNWHFHAIFSPRFALSSWDYSPNTTVPAQCDATVSSSLRFSIIFAEVCIWNCTAELHEIVS
jgi:hypothetical protein